MQATLNHSQHNEQEDFKSTKLSNSRGIMQHVRKVFSKHKLTRFKHRNYQKNNSRDIQKLFHELPDSRVQQVTCNCSKGYIGMSKRRLSARISKLERDGNTEVPVSGPSKHLRSEQHQRAWLEYSINSKQGSHHGSVSVSFLHAQS